MSCMTKKIHFYGEKERALSERTGCHPTLSASFVQDLFGLVYYQGHSAFCCCSLISFFCFFFLFMSSFSFCTFAIESTLCNYLKKIIMSVRWLFVLSTDTRRRVGIYTDNGQPWWRGYYPLNLAHALLLRLLEHPIFQV